MDGGNMTNGENEAPTIVITRKVGEMIRLGDDVYVRVERIWPDRVGLQVIAPPCVSVLRGEIHAAIRKRGSDRGPSGW